MGNRQNAKELLRYYFQMLALRSGGPLSDACLEEIGRLVDLIIEAAVAEAVQAVKGQPVGEEAYRAGAN